MTVEPKQKSAREFLDEWNDVTGFVAKGTSYYYELISVIQDAMDAAAGKTTYYGLPVHACNMIPENSYTIVRPGTNCPHCGIKLT